MISCPRHGHAICLDGLRDEWFCWRGEQAALDMGLATRELLDAR